MRQMGRCGRVIQMKENQKGEIENGRTKDEELFFKKKVKLCSYIAQYLVRWTPQRTLHHRCTGRGVKRGGGS